MQYQGIEEQRIVNTGLLPIARDLDLPLVCTNDVHYLRQTDQHPHDVLLCIGTGKSVSDEKRLQYHGDQFFLKTAEEMRQVFGDYPEALANTVRIAERCNVKLPKGEAHLPDFAVPPGYDARVVLRARRPRRVRRADAAAGKALEATRRAAPAARRLRSAARATRSTSSSRMKYPGYFLIVWDFIRYAREQGDSRRARPRIGRRQPGRLLPADHRRRPAALRPVLRALPEPRARQSLPDIDIDFCERRRGEVINYVTEKYGRENVAQIITFGTMKAKAAVRDVGRVMEMPISDVDRVAKLIPTSST